MHILLDWRNRKLINQYISIETTIRGESMEKETKEPVVAAEQKEKSEKPVESSGGMIVEIVQKVLEINFIKYGGRKEILK